MKESSFIRFYCGTSNVVLPFRNKSLFPEEFLEKSRLNFYSSLLNSVEVNSTFYKLPLARTVEKWLDEVPESFRFTFKMHKSITHCKDLLYSTEELNKFWLTVNAAGAKKGCILIQFPASIKFSAVNFSRIRDLLTDSVGNGLSAGWKLAIEFRDTSWYKESVYTMLENYSCVIVVHDMPKSTPPMIEMKRNFIYLRFHGEGGRYAGSYPDYFLEEYAGYILDWLDEGLEVFAYFNNTRGEAIFNVLTLNKMITGRRKIIS